MSFYTFNVSLTYPRKGLIFRSNVEIWPKRTGRRWSRLPNNVGLFLSRFKGSLPDPSSRGPYRIDNNYKNSLASIC